MQEDYPVSEQDFDDFYKDAIDISDLTDLASNENTPLHILKKLSKHPSAMIREKIATNAAISQSIVKIIAKEKTSKIMTAFYSPLPEDIQAKPVYRLLQKQSIPQDVLLSGNVICSLHKPTRELAMQIYIERTYTKDECRKLINEDGSRVSLSKDDTKKYMKETNSIVRAFIFLGDIPREARKSKIKEVKSPEEAFAIFVNSEKGDREKMIRDKDFTSLLKKTSTGKLLLREEGRVKIKSLLTGGQKEDKVKIKI